MNNLNSRRNLHRLLTLVIAAGVLTGARPDALRGSSDMPPASVVQSDDASNVIGAGPDREKIACVLCAGTIVGVGNTTVFGLAVISGIFPEAVIGCATLCALAFT
ncbi:hypothetical protein [Gaopeijia maritima]|uniref:MFS transporter n=1 Tax=Gaopeijia maritima TaxID=3119007 RepID=A0ABU9ECK1_9BACT